MITEVQKIERLQQLRRVVEAATDHRFHMRTFCEEADCGTAYCAAGWAAIDPWFRENTAMGDIFEVGEEGMLREADDVYDPFENLGGVFGISYLDSLNLFGADLSRIYSEPHAVSRAEVIANVDRLIAGEPATPYAAIRAEHDDEGEY